jgi:hypothetical protein
VFTIRAIKKPEMVFLYVLKFEEIANLLFAGYRSRNGGLLTTQGLD